MTSSPPPAQFLGQPDPDSLLWQFGQVEPCSFHARRVDDRSAVRVWHPATVPGNVRSDLLALGVIPDPLVGENWRRSQWVEQVDWWYRTRLQTDLAPGERLFLRFRGVDYRWAVFVNQREVLRHEGMFSPQVVELTAAARAGSVVVAVRLWASGRLPRRRLSAGQRAWGWLGEKIQNSWLGVYPPRTATLKAQFGFGWDFMPPIRTMGLWEAVEVHRSGPTWFCGLRVQVNPSGQALAEVEFYGPPPTSLQLTIRPKNFVGPSESWRFSVDDVSKNKGTVSNCAESPTASLKAWTPKPYNTAETPNKVGSTCVRWQFRLKNVRLWQVWERGEPHLYEAHVTEPGSLGGAAVTFGVRSVRWEGWRLWLNGERLFLRGLNWVPADALPGRLRAADYEAWVARAKLGGANLLRVWGGGLREKAAFYSACGAAGVLVWQELPLACAFLGAYPQDARFGRLWAQEVRAIGRRLDCEPSVVLWGGGNEISPRRHRALLHSARQILAEETLSPRRFVPASPGWQDEHAWGVWHGWEPFRRYQRVRAQMVSEAGLQAVPQSNAVAEGPETEAAITALWGDVARLRRYGSLAPGADLGPESRWGAWAQASQWAQAVGWQTLIEHQRRRGAAAGGVVLWQFNEPWPGVTWAIVDYFGRPKLGFAGLQGWFQPILVSLRFAPGHRWRAGERFKAGVWLVNDTLAEVRGQLSVAVDGRVIWSAGVQAGANEARRVGRLVHRFETDPQTLRLWLTVGGVGGVGGILAENRYPLNWADSQRPNWWQRFRRWGAGAVLR